MAIVYMLVNTMKTPDLSSLLCQSYVGTTNLLFLRQNVSSKTRFTMIAFIKVTLDTEYI
jgi:hypothetical protein